MMRVSHPYEKTGKITVSYKKGILMGLTSIDIVHSEEWVPTL
jgi:hypothetical protein